jgi:hypothetical protein
MPPNFAQRIKPVDPERFRFAMGVFGAAAALKGPAPNPTQFSVNIQEDDGSVTKLSLTDRPENRGILALKQQFPNSDDLESMSFRILTLREVLRDDKLSKLGVVRRDEDGNTEIHDAVTFALATAPFRKSGKLDRAAFIAIVKSEFKRIESIGED